MATAENRKRASFMRTSSSLSARVKRHGDFLLQSATELHLPY